MKLSLCQLVFHVALVERLRVDNHYIDGIVEMVLPCALNEIHHHMEQMGTDAS
jgi:hypothetical protein